jgi:hypothetical protein
MEQILIYKCGHIVFNLQIVRYMIHLQNATSYILSPSGEDIVFVLSVCHKSLYVQLLHFKRKFLKTLHACLLIKDTKINCD